MLQRIRAGLREAITGMDPGWRFGLGSFAAGRLLYWLWSLIILWIMPLAVQNITLGGEPLLAVFDMHTSRGFLYGRQVGNQLLTFRPSGTRVLIDAQTGSLWDLEHGLAFSGFYEGTALPKPSISESSVFPCR